MKRSNDSSGTADPRGFRRVAPALALFFIAPFVAEFLLGDFSIDALWLILFVGPMYGGGALVVREVARRLGRGWPTILLLALGYGLLEEGIVIQTLFNPNYLGLHLLKDAPLAVLGMGGWWTVFVLTLHTVWSISVPIAIVEGLFADRRTKPWLGNVGLIVSALLLVAGALMMHATMQKQEGFAASTVQIAGTWAAIVVVVVLALCCRPTGTRRSGSAPSAWSVGVITFILSLAFMAIHKAMHGWALAGLSLALDLVGIALILTWSRRSGWTPVHTLSAAGGALLTYACYGFQQQPVVGSKGTVDLVGNALFAALAVALLVLAVRKERKLVARGAGVTV